MFSKKGLGIEGTGGGIACDPHKFSFTTAPDLAALVVERVGKRLVDRDLRFRPSFAPTLFQPLLWALMALWRVPGEAVKAQSGVGGVVGGVMGSIGGGEVDELSSVVNSSLSPASLDDEAGWWAASFRRLRFILRWGRNDDRGDRLLVSSLVVMSLDERERDRLCLFSFSDGFSSGRTSL